MTRKMFLTFLFIVSVASYADYKVKAPKTSLLNTNLSAKTFTVDLLNDCDVSNYPDVSAIINDTHSRGYVEAKTKLVNKVFNKCMNPLLQKVMIEYGKVRPRDKKADIEKHDKVLFASISPRSIQCRGNGTYLQTCSVSGLRAIGDMAGAIITDIEEMDTKTKKVKTVKLVSLPAYKASFKLPAKAKIFGAEKNSEGKINLDKNAVTIKLTIANAEVEDENGKTANKDLDFSFRNKNDNYYGSVMYGSGLQNCSFINGDVVVIDYIANDKSTVLIYDGEEKTYGSEVAIFEPYGKQELKKCGVMLGANVTGEAIRKSNQARVIEVQSAVIK